jgi:hypothetical protein
MGEQVKCPGGQERPINHSLRLSQADTDRVKTIADAREWTVAKTLAKLVALALDARLLK